MISMLRNHTFLLPFLKGVVGLTLLLSPSRCGEDNNERFGPRTSSPLLEGKESRKVSMKASSQEPDERMGKSFQKKLSFFLHSHPCSWN